MNLNAVQADLRFEFEIDTPALFPVVYLGRLFQSLKLISDHHVTEGKEHDMVSVHFWLAWRDLAYSRRRNVYYFSSVSFTIHG